jgi:8-oxo-dGTP pyrophosphatase MutT (NUDIX family)
VTPCPPVFHVNARAIIERMTGPITEVLVQLRTKPGEPQTLEFPGGQLNLFEGIPDALRREVQEETGLTITAFVEPLNATVTATPVADVECLTPSFVYQTRRGPVDSVGFFFRVQAEGELTRRGDHAERHQWLTLEELRHRLHANPQTFHWLTQAAARQYLNAGEPTP